MKRTASLSVSGIGAKAGGGFIRQADGTNAEKLSPRSKIMSVKRDDTGKMTGAVLDAID